MEYIKLGDLGEIVSGGTPKTDIDEYWNGTNLWITPAELSDDSYLIDNTLRKITDVAIKKSNVKLLPKGTVLLSSRAPIGKVAIANADMYCNQGFKNIICGEKLYNKFLFNFLKYKNEYIQSLGRGATFKEISKEIVSNIMIPIYSVEDQIKISIIFEKISELIRIKKDEIVMCHHLIKSQFVKEVLL